MKKKKILKVTCDSRTYRILRTIDQDPFPYSEECWSVHYAKGSHTRSTRKWKRKVIFKFEYREYRTWKYNRKTRWK